MRIIVMARHAECADDKTFCDFATYDKTFEIENGKLEDFVAAFKSTTNALNREFAYVSDDMLSNWIAKNWKEIVRDKGYPSKIEMIKRLRDAIPGRSLEDYKDIIEANASFMECINAHIYYQKTLD